MKKSVKILYFLIASVIAVTVGLLYLSENLSTSTIRNGEEYCDFLMNEQFFEQEIALDNTWYLLLDVLPDYTDLNKNIGIDFELKTTTKTQRGFIPIVQLENKSWTTIIIEVSEKNYLGKAKLKLTAVGTNSENGLQFLIATNQMQKNPEMKLLKDNDVIENGRLSATSISLHLKEAVPIIVATFLIITLLCLNSSKVLKGIKEYPHIYIVCFLFLFFTSYKFKSLYNINLWNSPSYFCSYQNLGFVRRAFAGTIIEMLGVPFGKNEYVFYGISCIALMLTLELIIIYNRNLTASKRCVEKIYAFFLCTPFSLITFWGHHFFARLDILLINAFLLTCIIIIYDRFLFIIPVLTVMAILTHEMYVAIFVPFIFCLLLYKWYLAKKNNYLICLAITSFTALITSIYLSFFSKIAIPYDKAWNNISKNADIDMLWNQVIKTNYYSTFNELLNVNFKAVIAAKTVPAAILSLIVFLPVVLLAIIWLKTFFLAQRNILGRIVVFFFPATGFGLLVCMITGCDWGRFFVMYGIGVFFSVIALWSVDTDQVRLSIESILENSKKIFGANIYVLLIVMYAVLSSLKGGGSSTTLFESIRTLIH